MCWAVSESVGSVYAAIEILKPGIHQISPRMQQHRDVEASVTFLVDTALQ
jgi:hypothetical protein